jgi:hypothetical protein
MLQKDDLLDIVTADLVFLREEWDEEVDDHSLRRSSTILRRLLVDNELQRAWKAAHFEKEPIIEASTLQKIIGVTPLDKVVFAAAGGARYKGAELRGVIMRNYALTPEEIKKESEHGVPSASFGLHAFIEAPCVIIKENLISRRILIKYVSNKLGGAHHDSKRGKTEEELVFSLLDGTQQYRLLNKPAVYFELLSAGQAIARSGDVARLIAKANPNAKANNSTPNNGLQNDLSQGVGS